MTWSLVDLDLALSSANGYLRRIAGDVRDCKGFKETNDRPAGTAWATADGMLGLVLSGTSRSDPLMRHCVSVLLQVWDPELGGWRERGVPNVDATAMCVIALVRCAESPVEQLVPALSSC